MQDAPFLIAGAGIGGLTAALALGRAGFPCLLVEQRTQIEEIGAGLQLSPNASRILIELGLEPVLARYAATPERLLVRDGTDGKTLSTLPIGPSFIEKFGAPYWSIHRADLQTVLLDAVRGLGNVRLIFGRKVSAIIKNDDQGLIVTCSSATQSEDVSCRALIGADGLWSNVADLIGPAKAPEFLGYQAWRGLIPIKTGPPICLKQKVAFGSARKRILCIIRCVAAMRSMWSRSHRTQKTVPAGRIPGIGIKL